MAVNVITYTYDVATNRIFVLVNDGSTNLQIYVGDISGFNQNSTDVSPLKWSKYTRQPLGLPVAKDNSYDLNIRYAAKAIYLRDTRKGTVTKLPESLTEQVSKIKVGPYSEDPHSAYKFDAFHVFSNGSFYYGVTGGVFYVDEVGSVGTSFSLGLHLNDIPTSIKGNKQIVITTVQGETNGVYVSRVEDKGNSNRKKWHKIGLEQPGRVFGIFIDESNYIANLVTIPNGQEQEGGDGYSFTMNRFSFAKFLIDPVRHPLEPLAPLSLNSSVYYGGIVTNWIDAIQIADGVRVGFIDRTSEESPLSRSVLLTSKGDAGRYDITYEAKNAIKLDSILEGQYKAQSTMGIPNDYCAFFLDMSGYFYIAPGGITKPFQKIDVEKIN